MHTYIFKNKKRSEMTTEGDDYFITFFPENFNHFAILASELLPMIGIESFFLSSVSDLVSNSR